jgi:hypothetical protein
MCHCEDDNAFRIGAVYNCEGEVRDEYSARALCALRTGKRECDGARCSFLNRSNETGPESRLLAIVVSDF